jgi:choline kinase
MGATGRAPAARRAVILAAGLGRRIRPLGSPLPKPLLPVNGRALISYTLEALAATDVEEVVVVTGHQAHLVTNALGEGADMAIRFASNPDYYGGSAGSLLAARDFCEDEPFLLLMSDHLFSPELLCLLLDSAETAGATVAADFGRYPAEYEEEATRLELDSDRRTVRAIGKGLDRWDALDTGAFVCTRETWSATAGLSAQANVNDVFSALARRELLFAADVTGAFWYDVDTPDDLAAAEAMLAAGHGGAP